VCSESGLCGSSIFAVKPDGSWLVVGANDWTAGFHPAALVRTYERTRNPVWPDLAGRLAAETMHDSTDLDSSSSAPTASPTG
jgi:hypothetical protein